MTKDADRKNNGLAVCEGGEYAVCVDETMHTYGWVHQLIFNNWVTLRKATDEEIERGKAASQPLKNWWADFGPACDKVQAFRALKNAAPQVASDTVKGGAEERPITPQPAAAASLEEDLLAIMPAVRRHLAAPGSTPETDAAAYTIEGDTQKDAVDADFARRLERQRDELATKLAEKERELVEAKKLINVWSTAFSEQVEQTNTAQAALKAQPSQPGSGPSEAKDAERYRWWRENIDCIEDDGDGIVGVAFCYQIPLHGLDSGVPEQTHAELMDAIADRGIVSERLHRAGGE